MKYAEIFSLIIIIKNYRKNINTFIFTNQVMKILFFDLKINTVSNFWKSIEMHCKIKKES